MDAESLVEEVRSTRDEGPKWSGLEIVKECDPFLQGKGVYVQFLDKDEDNNLEQRLEKIFVREILCRRSVDEVGVWIGHSLWEIKNAKPGGQLRNKEKKYQKSSAAMA